MNYLAEMNDSNKRHYIEDKCGLLTLSEANKLHFNNDISKIDGVFIIPKNYKNDPFISQEEYNDAFLQNYMIISELLMPGVILCGGAASGGLVDLMSNPPNDFDLFMYGDDSIEEKNIKINKILMTLYTKYKELYIRQVNGVINIETLKKNKTDNSLKVQIILRDYYSISEILHSFDISCCAVAWDGTTTYMTQFAQWSNLYKIIVATPKYRSHTYELRLMKYFNKGFALLLPHLELPPMHSKLILSKIEINFIYVNGNMAIAEVNIISFDMLNVLIPTRDSADYDTISLEKMYYSIWLRPIEAPIFDRTKYNYELEENFIYFERKFKYIITGEGFLEGRTILTKKNISKYSISIEVEINKLISYEMYMNWAIQQIRNLIIPNNGITLNDGLLKSLLGEHYEQFAIDNNLDDIKEQLNCINEILEEVKNTSIFILSKLKENALQLLMNIYNAKKDNLYSFMIPINRAIPLTGSLRPCGQTDEEWYGGNFRAEKMPQQYFTIQEFLHIYKTEIEKQICSICLHEIEPFDTNIIDLKCGHKYHFNPNGLCDGISNWLKPKQNSRVPTCPDCRTQFPIKEQRLQITNKL